MIANVCHSRKNASFCCILHVKRTNGGTGLLQRQFGQRRFLGIDCVYWRLEDEMIAPPRAWFTRDGGWVKT